MQAFKERERKDVEHYLAILMGYGYVRIGDTVYLIYNAAMTEDVPERIEYWRRRGYRVIPLNLDNEQDCEYANEVFKKAGIGVRYPC